MLETVTVDYALENYFAGRSNDTDPAAKCERKRNVSNQELYFLSQIPSRCNAYFMEKHV